LLDSRHWKLAPTAARAPFELDGDAVPGFQTATRRTWISTAEGILARVAGSVVWIEGDNAVQLRHSLPSSFDLGVLLGRRVRVTLVHAFGSDGGLTQTLTIAGCDGRALLIAHAGDVRSAAHQLGSLQVYVALSQRVDGPMVFGTRRVQSLVRAGDHVRVRHEGDGYVMQFQSRSGERASYAIACESLWRGPPSTRRSRVG
jgi:hypothetical protein